MNKAFLFSSIICLLFALAITSCGNHDIYENDNGSSSSYAEKEPTYFTETTGVITYTYEHLPLDPINVYYHVPATGNKSSMPILIVMHGTNRNAESYRNTWVNHSNEKKFMVFAPEFVNAGSFSGSRGYNQGGMYRTSNLSTLKDKKEWTYSVIEALFDFIKEDFGSTQNAYDIWGHSAGGQFVHRYVMFMPDARINKAVAANAGWYAVPDLEVDYPYGLKGSTATEATLKTAFAKKLYIELGTADNDPNAVDLERNDEADKQGTNRYDRGNYFWGVAQRESEGSVFNWEKVEIEGVAHSQSQMARGAFAIFNY